MLIGVQDADNASLAWGCGPGRRRSLFSFGFWEVAPPKLRLVQDDLAASRVLASGGKCLGWGTLSVVSFGKVARKGRRPLWACSWPVAVSPEALSDACIPKTVLLTCSSLHR